jgi:hypothetical protein
MTDSDEPRFRVENDLAHSPNEFVKHLRKLNQLHPIISLTVAIEPMKSKRVSMVAQPLLFF